MGTRRIIAVDFDGCLCENRWPEIGPPNQSVFRRLRRAQLAGAAVILWTCREGARLDEAVDWCARHGLHFDAVNTNLPELVEAYRYDCRKINATEYWDDRAVQIEYQAEEGGKGWMTLPTLFSLTAGKRSRSALRRGKR